jgi:uncharacterized membrane protein
MRWLLIVLLVSLVGLLIAAAGGAIHIWVRRAQLRSKPASNAENLPKSAPGLAEESDQDADL